MAHGSKLNGPVWIDGVPVVPNSAFWQQGKIFYLDPENGSDGYKGDSADRPLATLDKAYSLLRDERGDKIILMNDGNTGASCRLTETLTWAKDNCALIGTCPQQYHWHRSRITGEASGATFTPIIKVTGHGNYFANFMLFGNYGVDPVGLELELANRNVFENVHITGMGLTAGAADAAACDVLFDGASENYFTRCTFGVDTIVREAANANLRFRINGSQACTRNYFEDCEFEAFAGSSGAGALFVDMNESGCIDRTTVFKNCHGTNAIKSTATAMTNAMNVHASAGGLVRLEGTTDFYGCTDVNAADNANVIGTNAFAAGTTGLGLILTR